MTSGCVDFCSKCQTSISHFGVSTDHKLLSGLIEFSAEVQDLPLELIVLSVVRINISMDGKRRQ